MHNGFSFLFCSFAFSQSTSNYDISVTTIWNTTDHTSIPSDPHWSPLVGATHKNLNDILEFGVVAPMTDGIKDVAERGSNSKFMSEINTNSNADQYLQSGFSPRAANNSVASLNVNVNEDFPYITLVSMVAPSPDWFIAVNSENLRSGNNLINNGWKDTYIVDVITYDSGTDNGIDYEAANFVSIPRQPIAMVSGAPVNGNKMGTLTFTYNSSTLSNATLNNIDSIKIFPNPTNGNITISNIQNIELKTIEIYSVLGKLVKQIHVRQNPSKLNLDLSQFNSGMYLLKVLDTNGASHTQKLVID